MQNYEAIIPAPVKVGNIKIGVQRLGNPIALQTLLVTKPTKNGNENFTVMNGFDPMGEATINVTVPFDRPDFNFRVGYTTFLTINGLDYVGYAANIGDLIIAKPIHTYRKEAPVVSLGLLSKRSLIKYSMKYMGFLQVELIQDVESNIFGMGEVFYYKTQSKHTIQAIQSQLHSMYAMSGSRLSGLKMTMKAVTKDVHGKQVTFASLSTTRDELNIFAEERAKSPLDYAVRDEQYQESIEYQNSEAIDISSDSKYIVKIDDSYTETAELKDRKKGMEEDKIKATKILEDIGNTLIPAVTAVKILKKINWNVDDFKAKVNDKTTMIEALKL